MKFLQLSLRAIVFGGVVLQAAIMPAEAASGKSMLVYIGTYTGAKSRGIYSARFDSASGRLSDLQLAAETKNPTFLALSPDQRFLYAANEIGDFGNKPSGAVSAFSIDKNSGQLKLLNQQPSAGSGPCHVAVDPTGKCVLVANYGSGSVAAFRVAPDGQLSYQPCQIQHQGSSINAQRQEGPHAHFITTDPGNRYVLSCDLGLDQVLVYQFDPTKAALTANEPPAARVTPGAGPRHLAFHPNGRWVYVINELNSTITGFDYDKRHGSLKARQTLSTLKPGHDGKNSCAEIIMHPSGKWVYGSNRGDNSIAIFSINGKTGELSLSDCQSTRGKTPRHFTLDPSGNWLLAENQDSNDIFVFRVDTHTGRLEPVGERTEVGSPVCLLFLH